jgi:hypothetical protein
MGGWTIGCRAFSKHIVTQHGILAGETSKDNAENWPRDRAGNDNNTFKGLGSRKIYPGAPIPGSITAPAAQSGVSCGL